ncbi:NAD(P)-binding domain-containing protein [Robbsia sp. KACC 23696]|uniref:NADPH-dependent F420 reductase n=1 Tax=Robbsia sp. KACC 23696 TaxID=3149231 RepID=UPI00325A47C8
MRHAIIGFGQVGQALAWAFARNHRDVAVAGRRPVSELLPLAREIGPSVKPVTLEEAIEADTVILAVPFWEHRTVAKARANWQGRTIVDATNAYGVPVEELDGLPSSTVIAKAFPGGTLVKAFNHLPAAVLAADPHLPGGRRVVFLASDDERAVTQVSDWVAQLGFAPIDLGTLAEGGTLVQARGRNWAKLIFQDLVKPDKAE